MSTQAVKSTRVTDQIPSTGAIPATKSSLVKRTESQATKIYTCEKCGQTFELEANLLAHLWCISKEDLDSAVVRANVETARDAALKAIPQPPIFIDLPSPAVTIISQTVPVMQGQQQVHNPAPRRLPPLPKALYEKAARLLQQDKTPKE